MDINNCNGRRKDIIKEINDLERNNLCNSK
jgi:hypothetical protein